jgi:hypothetical protein
LPRHRGAILRRGQLTHTPRHGPLPPRRRERVRECGAADTVFGRMRQTRFRSSFCHL